MSKWYRVIGLAVVLCALLGVAAARLGAMQGRRHPQIEAIVAASAAAPSGSNNEECCAPAPTEVTRTTEKPPSIPATPGRPCLVELGSDECASCKAMTAVLAELRQRLAGKVDIVTVDTDKFPSESARWRLKLIPTQIVLDRAGNEVVRHEGKLSADEVLALLAAHGIDGG